MFLYMLPFSCENRTGISGQNCDIIIIIIIIIIKVGDMNNNRCN